MNILIKLFAIAVLFVFQFICIVMLGNSIVVFYVILLALLLLKKCNIYIGHKVDFYLSKKIKNLESLIQIIYCALFLFSCMFLTRIVFIYPYSWFTYVAIVVVGLLISWKMQHFIFIFKQLVIFQLVLTVILCVFIPKFNLFDFDWAFSSERILKRELSYVNGFNKIYYVKDYSDNKNKGFLIPGIGYKKYFDAYRIKETENSLIFFTYRLEQLMLYNFSEKNFKGISTKILNLFFDPFEKIFFAGWYKEHFDWSFCTKINIKNLAITKKITLKEENSVFKETFRTKYFPDGLCEGFIRNGKIYVLTMKGELKEINWEEGKIRNCAQFPNLIGESVYDNINDTAYFINGLGIYKIDMRTCKIIKFQPLLGVMRINIDPENQFLTVNTPWPKIGKFVVYDLKNFEKVKVLNNISFCRESILTADKKFIFIGNYFNGVIDVYEYDNLNKIFSFYAGPQIRTMYYSKSRKRLYIVSALGIFEFDPTFLNKEINTTIT